MARAIFIKLLPISSNIILLLILFKNSKKSSLISSIWYSLIFFLVFLAFGLIGISAGGASGSGIFSILAVWINNLLILSNK